MTLQELQEIELDTVGSDPTPMAMSFVSWGDMCL